MKRESFILIVLILVAVGIYKLYEPFWLSIVVGSLLAISTSNIQNKLLELVKSRFLASLISTILLAALFFAPLGYFLFYFSAHVAHLNMHFVNNIESEVLHVIRQLPSPLYTFEQKLETSLIQFDPATMSRSLLSYASMIGSYAMSFVSGTFSILIFYFFSHYYGKEIFEFFHRSGYFPKQETTILLFEMRSSMSVVFYSILVTAVFQGILFGGAVETLGYNGLLFAIMYGFASLIPVVGGVLMWAPFSLYELSLGHTHNAIFIALYTIIVISLIADTLIKPFIIKMISQRLTKPGQKINELIIFFAILAGLSTFGFWGMIIGPALTVLFLTLLRIAPNTHSLPRD